MVQAHFKMENDGTVSYQSVRAHLVETSVLSERFASKINMAAMGKLLGILHDTGKNGHAYQTYLKACEQYELGYIPVKPRKGSVDHGIFGAVYVMQELRDPMDPFSEMTAETLAMVIAYHHGGLKDYLGPDTSTPLWSRIEHYQEDRPEEYEYIKEVFEKTFSRDDIRKMFLEAVSEMRNLKNRLPHFTEFQLHLVIKYLYSCLIDADRENTRCFMEGEWAEKKGNVSWKEYERRLERFLGELHDKIPQSPSERKIKELREQISDACCEAGGWPAGVYKLTVPTGGGKTLASLRMALRHIQGKALANDLGHIIQVLPFTSIIEQNAAVVRKVLQCKDDLLEHHSNVFLGNQGEDDCNLSKEQYQLLTERWNQLFIFTTTVQFLNTVYKGGTQNIRRMHNLANSVIIMDEAQALPLRTMRLFGELVTFLYHVCNTTILLCTATQPNMEKLPIGIEADVKEIIPDVTEKFKRFQRMNVVDRLIDGGYSIEQAVDFIEGVKYEVKSLLIVMNTKKVTREIYESLRKKVDEQTEVLYITTDLCPAHRNDVIRHLKDLLKKKESVICVSTSILEAGVDVSFEGVIRNLAGLDSIAQSSGRGNRHGENEQKGITYIINIADEKLGPMKEIAIGEEKTRAVLNTYRSRPDVYDDSLLSPAALTDYYQKYFYAEDIESQMRYPLTGDLELKDLYSYFSKVGGQVLRRRYQGKMGVYKWKLTFPFETAGEKFRVIDQDTVSILVPYGKGKDLIRNFMGKGMRYSLSEMRDLLKTARPYFVNLYTNRIQVYQQAVVASPMPGVLILKDGYYDEVTGIKEEQTLEFLSC